MSENEQDLNALRREIDRIDEAMHGLLMERGGIIDRLIASKGTAASGSAFRPEREASMMQALAARHGGRLPLVTVEGIWRLIISTFTFVQAPFAVHGDVSSGEAAMRDCARFHFGFAVPYREQPEASAVIAAVANSRGDLGLVSPKLASGEWWRALEPEAAPKVIARLPFLDDPSHPAGLPTLVISKAPSGEGPGAIALLSAKLTGGLPEGADIVARAGSHGLLAVPRERAADVIALGAIPVGGHPAR